MRLRVLTAPFRWSKWAGLTRVWSENGGVGRDVERKKGRCTRMYTVASGGVSMTTGRGMNE